MSLLFPRFAYTAPAAVRCGPAFHQRDIAPLFSLFDDTLNELNRASSRHARKQQWNPRFDVKESKDVYTVDAEVPGVDQNNLSIEFTDEHTLTVKGRSDRKVEKGKRPESLEAATEPSDAVENGAATPTSEKSHHATVEDEEPANSSAAADQTTSDAVAAQPTANPTVQEPEQPKEQYWYSERRTGEFQRSFKFPLRVDQEAVKASLKNGVLSIVVPKAAAPESRRINIE